MAEVEPGPPPPLPAVAGTVRFELENVEEPGPGGHEILVKLTVEEPGSADFEGSVTLGPDNPLAHAQLDAGYRGDFDFTIGLVSADEVAIATRRRAAFVQQRITESLGVIADASARPYAPDARQAQVEVDIVNLGDLPTHYLVTVSSCSANIEPGIPFQLVRMNPVPTVRQTLVFDLTSDNGCAAGNACTVKTRSRTGRLYESLRVVFPSPS